MDQSERRELAAQEAAEWMLRLQDQNHALRLGFDMSVPRRFVAPGSSRVDTGGNDTSSGAISFQCGKCASVL